jgi:tetraacyldisaccharide 4'-kinase
MSWGNPENAAESFLASVLRPASAAYGVGAYARLVGYSSGLLRRHRLDAPVISIGNITCGGTGKTPLTIDLASRLIAAGRKVGILSRGYKRRSQDDVVIVSDGRHTLAPVRDAGDEPYMVARSVKEAAVIVGARRHITGAIATALYDCDALILDDGFQHLQVTRDADLVLIDYNDDPENDALLPAGRLREPLSALSRADHVVITRVPENPDQHRLSKLTAIIARRAPNALQSACRFIPHGLRPIDCPEVEVEAQALSGVKVIALAGIARPETFVADLERLGAKVVGTCIFPDHHWYTPQNLKNLRRHLAVSGAELVVTTVKDSVRIDAEAARCLPLSVLEIKTQWLGPVPLPSWLLTTETGADKRRRPTQCHVTGT